MLKLLIVLATLGAAQVHAAEIITPNPEITYGDVCDPTDKDFVGYRYGEKVPYCIRNVSVEQKARIYEAYGVPEHCRTEYTIDHFIPLAIGGSNRDPNLWPEHRHVKATRQNLEQELFSQIRRGEITQADAMKIIIDAKMNPPQPKPWRCGISE